MDDDDPEQFKEEGAEGRYTPNKIHREHKLDEIIYNIVTDGKDTAETYYQIEMIFPFKKKKEIPLHKHTKEDVTIYVIEGSFLIENGDETIKGAPYMAIKSEKNTEHSLKKVGNTKGKLLIFFKPAGFENYFGELNSLHTSSNDTNLKILDKENDYRKKTLHILEKKYGLIFS